MPDRNDECPLERLIEVIGGKWKVIILWRVLEGATRFAELRRGMPGVTPRTLTRQLRELERDGLLLRRVFAEVPSRVEYSATPMARSLAPILRAMHSWSQTELMPCASRERK